MESYFDSFEGDFTLRYRLQKLENGRSDIDLYQYLSLSLGDLEKDKLAWYYYGTMREDLDGSNSDSVTKEKINRLIFPRTPVENNPVVSSNPFFSIDESIEDGFIARSYELYVDVTLVPLLKNLRVGRQYMREIENLHFDGLKLEFDDFKELRFGMFGGKPVHFYETSGSGDYLAGAFAEYSPVTGSRLKMDYSYVNDNSDDFSGHGDNFFAFSLRQNIKGWWNIFAKLTMLDSNGRDAELRSTWVFPEHDFDVNISYFKQLNTLEDLTIEFDEFNAITGDYLPYSQYSFNLYKGLHKNVGVGLGVNIRELNEEKDEGSFNHEFDMYYVTLSLHDLPFKGTSIDITGDHYDTDDDDTRSIGIDIDQKLGEKTTISTGTYYSLFKFDSMSGSERDNVRVYFLDTKYEITGNLGFSMDYEFERTGQESFHTVETALKYEF